MVSTSYEQHGRTAQKQRTREALIAAARELVARGEVSTVEAAAEVASISRTTAYRYFPNQRLLLAAAHPETERDTLLRVDAPADDVHQRLELVMEAFTRLVLETEAQQRTMLRLSLEPPGKRGDLPLRRGRAIGWILEALAPLRSSMSEDAMRRLAVAIRSATGIEALVWLTDVAGLSRRQARERMRWTARALLRAALEGGPPP
jgi:AcrR family transcriptional regulator